jgi:hypothetical protein
MMSYWLDKMLSANDDGNNLSKLAPLVIFFVIWVVGAIAKAAQKGKKGTEEEPAKEQAKQEPGFDELAKKIRERYAEAKKEAGREVKQAENERLQPPASLRQQAPPISPSPARYPAAPKQPMFEVTRATGQPQTKEPAAYSMQSTPEQEGPTLRVVKGLEQTNVGTHLKVEKPTLQKVEPGLQKVDAITSENAKVSGEVEIIHHQYLSELAAQYATQDGFRKAILNYEILGPPISLRE